MITLSSWQYFIEFINEKLLDYRTYIYRGQARDDWKLESSLDRLLKTMGDPARPQAREDHLRNFKFAVRGRRGPSPPKLEDENDWWALGQHFGLATPLLDWTESPFVALYFAFEERREDTEFRIVYALSETAVRMRSVEIVLEAHTESKGETNQPGTLGEAMRSQEKYKSIESKTLEVIRPLSDENPNLVSQRGLFLRAPDGLPIESWVQENFEGEQKRLLLIKVRIPNRERETCLRSLNRMNINRLSLFPDLYGASRYCNTDLEIKNY